MYPIDRVVAQFPLLVNDYFSHLHKSHRLRVFLCGASPSNPHFDLRLQVKRLLLTRMGCDPFLGEEIPELGKPRINRDHLTIELDAAEKCNLIVMFLGSAGTIAEVTAFALNPKIKPKLVVFNDIHFKDSNSFIRRGPLKLLTKENVIYFDEATIAPSRETVRQLDVLLARQWFLKLAQPMSPLGSLPLDEFSHLAMIYSAFPLRYAELEELSPFSSRTVRKIMKKLFSKRIVQEEEGKYVPTTPLEKSGMPGEAIADIARVRASLLGSRLRDSEKVSDYRLQL